MNSRRITGIGLIKSRFMEDIRSSKAAFFIP